ncbi:sugar ABC transporter ATP-binding protein [Caldalkalibacillus salinus]|uniref:sugar ABC transporter ATP-binding protein n=1 Tax=Caldalkalibacillus salinus TaxID=2803787 RepID=UPI001924590A|nr:sugar ABC transporter ATP-binding protein [Caldalkalibacillus salinus]
MEGIHKTFSGVEVLKGVQFNLVSGECHALMGENGAGKSTLMKILSGIYRKDKGQINVKGETVHFSGPLDAISQGIAVIHQELNIIAELTVVENLFLGRELTYGKSGVLRWREMVNEATKYLERLELKIDPTMTAGALSVGQQQMLEIAKALSMNADVLIMDEPTASLTGKETETLFHIIRQLKRAGVGIVYISHRLEDIFAICDRITVLRDGAYIGTEATQKIDFNHVVRMMVGRDIGEQFPVRKTNLGDVCLEVEDLTRDHHLHHVSFSIREGEILGIAGLMGAGRTSLVRAIFGAEPIERGTIKLNQQLMHIRSPLDAITHGIAFVTEDRKHEGLFLDMSVKENLSMNHLDQVTHVPRWISSNKEESFVEHKIKQLNIKTSHLDQLVRKLSGGNQQKVVIGRWLGVQPKVLILDEPTRGVDVGAKKEIYQIMNALTEQNVAVIMVSSELPEILGMSDRVLVMHEGRVTADLPIREADQERIMHAATGGKNLESSTNI